MLEKWEGEGKSRRLWRSGSFLPNLLCLCSWIRGVEAFCNSAFLAQVMICGALVWSSSDAQDATGTAGIMAAICPACLDCVA